MVVRLDELVVHNLGVLADVSLEPGPGLTVVTGETGAGKTLLVGALGALLGKGLDADRIGPASEEVSVSARFVLDDGELVVRSRLARGGRTRSYLDGSVAAAAEVAGRLAEIVDVVAQHDALVLRREASVRHLLDRALDDAGQAMAEAYAAAWDDHAAVVARLEELGGDELALRREAELARHEADEIAAADLRPGEEDELAGVLDRLANAQELAATAAEAATAGEGVTEALGDIVAAARRIDRLDGTAGLARPAEGVAAELAELVRLLRTYGESITHDPEALEATQTRLARLSELRRRYGRTIADVIAHGQAADARADELAALLADAGRLEAEATQAAERLAAAGAELTAARWRAGERLATAATAHLTTLGFDDPVLAFELEPRDPAAHGCDRVALRFASDRRLEPGPLDRTASGGELSRVVLALRLAGGVGDAPVVVFDEVDAGIGGATALELGRTLAAVADGAQVLCVTHLPQVAAHADRHYVVDRDGPTATLRAVEGEERVAELTRMLSGLAASDRGREHARELLRTAGRTG